MPRLISVNTESSTEDDTEDRSPDHGGCSRDSREAGSVKPQGPGSKDPCHGHIPSRDLVSFGEFEEFEEEEAQPGLSHEEESCHRSTRMWKPPDRLSYF